MLAAPAAALVHALKYEGWAELAEVMAEVMARTLRTEPVGLRFDVIVPVPTTRRRERRRGYNQAALLGRALAARLDGKVVEALERRPRSGTQVALQPGQRAANVQTAFRPRDGASRRLRGSSVLLVDDVLTTGATARAAATALEGAGATRVTLLTFARALPGRA